MVYAPTRNRTAVQVAVLVGMTVLVLLAMVVTTLT
jgi:hypothetical protein